jgi:hypothetical protein
VSAPARLTAKLGGAPEDVAQVIERALTARNPRPRYTVTPSARLMLALRALLPDRAWDHFLRSRFPTPDTRPNRPVPAEGAPEPQRDDDDQRA